MTLFFTSIDSKTGELKEVHYMPHAHAYLVDLKTNNYKVAVLANVPEIWGKTDSMKVEKLKTTTEAVWNDLLPIDWSLFSAGIFVSSRTRLRKPAPFLFRKAKLIADLMSLPALYQGEDDKEVQAAKKVGLFGYTLTNDDDVFLPIQKIEAFTCSKN